MDLWRICSVSQFYDAVSRLVFLESHVQRSNSFEETFLMYPQGMRYRTQRKQTLNAKP